MPDGSCPGEAILSRIETQRVPSMASDDAPRDRARPSPQAESSVTLRGMRPAEQTDWHSCVQEAVAGERSSIHMLVNHLTPFIQGEVVRVLLKGPRARSASLHAEVPEWVQEVLWLLFADQGRLLCRWEPARGASLPAFVKLVARRHVARKLRVKAEYGLETDPRPSQELDAFVAAGPPLEAQIVERDLLAKVLDRLCRILTPKGLEMFGWLFVQEQSIEDVARRTGQSRTPFTSGIRG